MKIIGEQIKQQLIKYMKPIQKLIEKYDLAGCFIPLDENHDLCIRIDPFTSNIKPILTEYGSIYVCINNKNKIINLIKEKEDLQEAIKINCETIDLLSKRAQSSETELKLSNSWLVKLSKEKRIINEWLNNYRGEHGIMIFDDWYKLKLLEKLKVILQNEKK